MEYTVVLTREPDRRYSVEVPALKGCHTFGDTPREALQMAESAIRLFTDSLRDRGLPVPADKPDVRVSTRASAEVLVYRVTVREAELVA